MKTFAATLAYPDVAKKGESIPLSGYAQVGIAGLSKVQILVSPEDDEPPDDDPYLQAQDATSRSCRRPPPKTGAAACPAIDSPCRCMALTRRPAVPARGR